MQCTHVATTAEVEIDTLAARIREEALVNNATLVSPSFIGAWTRKNNEKVAG
jgi:hypothetical protein